MNERVVINRVGFRRKVLDGGWEYLVLPESFKSELCEGFDSTALARELIRLGYLTRSGGGKSSTTVKIPALGPKAIRVYIINSRIFEHLDASKENAES
jgi:hypothetical protein